MAMGWSYTNESFFNRYHLSVIERVFFTGFTFDLLLVLDCSGGILV